MIFKDALAQQLCEQGGKNIAALFLLVPTELLTAGPTCYDWAAVSLMFLYQDALKLSY